MPISSSVLLVSQQFDVSGGRITAALDGLSDHDFYRAPEATNHMLWLLGHVTNTRLGVTIYLGASPERPWNELFSKGSQPGDRDTLPTISEVRDAWEAAGIALAAQFDAVTEAKLQETCPRDFPIADKTMLGAVAFLAGHEFWHLGQMVALRKWLGHGQLVG
jgi:uncharacterized damage-inducible protein DinB